MYQRALYPGRFQPVHKGHLHAIKYALSKARELIIAVTASQFCYTPEDPFTAGERIYMLRLAIGDLYDKCYIVPIPNITNNRLWPHHVACLVPEFDVVFTNNDLVRLLFESAGYKVENIPWLDKNTYSGRNIRVLMAEGKAWEELVPRPVAEYLAKIENSHCQR